MSDFAETFEAIRSRQKSRDVNREALAAANRERMRQWSPEFYRMCEQLKSEGMFGRVVQFEVKP